MPPISFPAMEANLLKTLKNLNYIPIEAILIYLLYSFLQNNRIIMEYNFRKYSFERRSISFKNQPSVN